MSVGEPMIEVQGLHKCFHMYGQPSDRLRQMVMPPLRERLGLPKAKYFDEFWALRDVSFTVGRNETVGIVGRNGSGKSTLLQCICGTMTPTLGSVRTRGRIAALLELGSGFNPDFSGRENVFLNAAVLGLTQAETERCFDDIAAFADIGPFLDQPVKTYSSGMAVRLAFAVAIHVQPDILVVDEALSVGDELFQRKCFARIERLKADGMTVLFVSHSGATVVELCDRAVLLDSGELLTLGSPKMVVSQYQRLLYAPAAQRESMRADIAAGAATDLGAPAGGVADEDSAEALPFFDPGFVSATRLAYASRGAHIESPRVLTGEGETVNVLRRGQRYRYVYEVAFDTGANTVRFGMLIKTLSGLQLSGGVSSPTMQAALPWVAGGQRLQVCFEFECRMNPGTYFLSCGVLGTVGGEELFLHRIVDALAIRVLPEHGNTATELVNLCQFVGSTVVSGVACGEVDGAGCV